MKRRRVNVKDAMLFAGTALRLTRLVVYDDLGEWLIQRPAKTWAIARDGSMVEYEDGERALDPGMGWRSKLVSGLDCPFCVGFWVTAGVLGAATAAHVIGGKTEKIWRAGAVALGANYVLGHITTRLDSPL